MPLLKMKKKKKKFETDKVQKALLLFLLRLFYRLMIIFEQLFKAPFYDRKKLTSD